MGIRKPFLLELLSTCLAYPHKCGKLAEMILLPKSIKGVDPRRKLMMQGNTTTTIYSSSSYEDEPWISFQKRSCSVSAVERWWHSVEYGN